MDIPRVGFDLDCCVCDFIRPFLNNFRKMYGKAVYLNDCTEYSFEKSCGLGWKEVKQCIDYTIQDSLNNMPPISGAIPFIKHYYNDSGHVPEFITCRDKKHAEVTANWLSIYLKPVPFKLHLTTDTKSDIVIDKEIDIYIEDRVKYAEELADKEICTFIINWPWNQHCKESRYIERVEGWDFIRFFYDRRCGHRSILFREYGKD